MPRGPSVKSARDKILNEAVRLILLNGFNSTSIDAICASAKITKGGFFHHFDSKEALASEILKKYWTDTGIALSASRHLRTKSPLKRLIGVINFFEELFEMPKRPTACLIGNITQEVALTNPAVRTVCEEVFAEWTSSLMVLIAEAAAVRTTEKPIDVRGLAELIVSCIEGAFILVKASDDVKASRRTFNHLKNYLRIILT